VPQEPQDPPQQPPPEVSPPPKSRDCSESAPPANAKLETMTRVFIDSQLGHAWLLSRSANRVSTSNFSEQLSHRYS